MQITDLKYFKMSSSWNSKLEKRKERERGSGTV